MAISFNAATLLNGNGIDVNTLVSQIQSQESGQLTIWQQQQSDLQTQASALSNLNTDLSNLATAVNTLTDPLGALTAMTATSSMPGILTATAQSSAATANHVIVVSSLASAGTVYTDAVAGGADASILPSGAAAGDLKLQIGGSHGATENIPITAGSNDTLSSLVSYINQQSATNTWGVTAAVLNDASGARLAIYSQASGTPGALAITGNTTTDGNGNDTGNPTLLTFEKPVGGSDASLTIDGIPFSSTSNTVTGAIPGVTLNLISAEPDVPLQLTVGADTTQASTAINAFVVAYNALTAAINQQFTVDPTSNTEGPLGSDSSLRSLQSSLFADVNYSISGNSGFVNLASLGVNMNNDGTLTVDNTTLNNALSSNPSAVLNFFQNATQSFGNHFSSDLTNLTDPVNGLLNLDLAQNSTEQSDLSTQISNFQDQLATQKQQLINQYSEVNATLEEYPYLLAEVTAQLGNILPTSSNTSPTQGTIATSSTTSGTSGS